MSALVLAIVNDLHLRETIVRQLEREGLAALGAASVGEGVALARRAGPALVVLDQALVQGLATATCQELRWEGAPLILLLAEGGSAADAVAALEGGADEYVSLPCSMPELMARILSLLRRRRAGSGAGATDIRVGDLLVSVPRREVTLHGRAVSLAPKEFAILAALAEQAGRVVSRDELVRRVWKLDRPVKRQTLDVYLFSLRSKIEDHPERPARLVTVRGVGYRLVVPRGTLEPRATACGA